MQARVGEIGRQLLDDGKQAGRIGDARCNAEFAEQLDVTGIDKARMPHFERVSYWTIVAFRLHHAASPKPRVVPSRQALHVADRAWQELEKTA